MKFFRTVLLAALLGGAGLLYAGDDAKATEIYRQGRESYQDGDYRAASKKFEEAELYADSAVVKSNALRARIAALQMCELPYQEFLAIERMLGDYPEYADYVTLVNREYELARLYADGKREPSFWSLRWIPWLVDGDKSVEIFQKALERAPYADAAPGARLQLAYLLDKEGKNKESLEELRKIIRDYPESEERRWAHLALGNGLFELSRRGDGDARYSREAYDVFREFQNRYPDAPENDFIRTLLAQSRDIQAERIQGIADYYRKVGRKEAAARYYAQVLRDFSDTESAAESEKKLTELDRTFVPDDFPETRERREQRYEAYAIPKERGKLLSVPTRQNRKFLLPIHDLGLGEKNDPPAVATAGAAEEEAKK